MEAKLTDKFGRKINYLRLSVTDRCNLRCAYCMPERGLDFAPRRDLLTYEELLELMQILGRAGIDKVRITGGEPFVRNDLISFLEALSYNPYIRKISITSNLTLIRPHLEKLLELNIRDVNVSLDALDREKFHQIARRDEFVEVEEVMYEMIRMGFNLKLNCVVMGGTNDDQVLPLLRLAEKHPVSVRFLEEMPFNGSGGASGQALDYRQILALIGAEYAYTKLIDLPSSTSQNYQIEGFKGNFGVIPSFSRTFCGDCNRLRLAATGEVRTCLYGKGQLNLRDLLRSGCSEGEILEALRNAIWQKPKDGFEAAEENERTYLSMTKLGG